MILSDVTTKTRMLVYDNQLVSFNDALVTINLASINFTYTTKAATYSWEELGTTSTWRLNIPDEKLNIYTIANVPQNAKIQNIYCTGGLENINIDLTSEGWTGPYSSGQVYEVGYDSDTGDISLNFMRDYILQDWEEQGEYDYQGETFNFSVVIATAPLKPLEIKAYSWWGYDSSIDSGIYLQVTVLNPNVDQCTLFYVANALPGNMYDATPQMVKTGLTSLELSFDTLVPTSGEVQWTYQLKSDTAVSPLVDENWVYTESDTDGWI